MDITNSRYQPPHHYTLHSYLSTLADSLTSDISPLTGIISSTHSTTTKLPSNSSTLTQIRKYLFVFLFYFFLPLSQHRQKVIQTHFLLIHIPHLSKSSINTDSE